MSTTKEDQALGFSNRHACGRGHVRTVHVQPLLARKSTTPKTRKTQAQVGIRFCSTLIPGCAAMLVISYCISQVHSPLLVMKTLDSGENVVERLSKPTRSQSRVLGGFSQTKGGRISHRHPRAVHSPSIYDATILPYFSSEKDEEKEELDMHVRPRRRNQTDVTISALNIDYVPHTDGIPLFKTKSCIPIKEWHAASHPTCNEFHSFDFTSTDDALRLVGMGGTRMVWKLDVANDVHHRGVVLRMMQWYRAVYKKSQYESQRIDAVVSERLTASPRVMNIYGFCGLSSFGEAGEKSKDWLASLYSLTPTEKLALGRELALALVDLHSIDGDGNVTAVYRNLKPDNILFVDGKLKINDFDEAVLLRWNVTGHRTCRFRLPTFPPREKPYQPAELSIYGNPLTEKIDIYSLGGVLYTILTGTRPYDKYGANNTEVARQMTGGILPRLRSDTRKRSDMATIAMREAFERCMSHNPSPGPRRWR